MKIKANSTFGNFSILAEAEVSDTLRDVLSSLGFLQVLQRSPASAAEKAMAGYEKRPQGFKRDSIPFSEGNAETLRKNLEAVKFEVDGKEYNIQADVVIAEYIPAVADVKMTDERNAYARNGKAGKLAALATKVGYAGEVGDGTSENAPVEFLRQIRAWSKAQIADI